MPSNSARGCLHISLLVPTGADEMPITITAHADRTGDVERWLNRLERMQLLTRLVSVHGMPQYSQTDGGHEQCPADEDPSEAHSHRG